MDRPEQRNAVSRRMNSELHDAWRRFRDDDEAFVLVITGTGDAFCAGWDLQDAADWPRPDWDEYREAMRRQGKSLIRVSIKRWGPIATGGFPPDVAAALSGAE